MRETDEIWLCTRTAPTVIGEEFQLVSNAFLDGEGFAIEGVTRDSGEVRRMRIPLSVVQMLRHELASREHTDIAAGNLLNLQHCFSGENQQCTA